MKQTNYTYFIDGAIVAIDDLQSAHAVPVEADSVLLELEDALGSLAGLLIIWRDREGIWNGLTYQSGKVSFYPIGVRSYQTARQHLMMMDDAKRLVYTFPEEQLALSHSHFLVNLLPNSYQ